MLKYTNKGLEFDPLAELVPVTMAASGPTAIVVRGSTEIQAVSDLRRVCTEPAAKCSWASGEIADVPTYAETGMGAVEFTNNWYGIFAPAGTPETVKVAISEGFRSAAADSAVLNVLGPLLITPVGNSPAEFGAVLQRDRQTVERLSGSLPTQ